MDSTRLPQKPFTGLTGGNAHIIGSRDNCCCQHIVAQGGRSKKKKENDFLRKMKALKEDEESNDDYLHAGLEGKRKVGFQHLG